MLMTQEYRTIPYIIQASTSMSLFIEAKSLSPKSGRNVVVVLPSAISRNSLDSLFPQLTITTFSTI
jgi:hypothetical protein